MNNLAKKYNVLDIYYCRAPEKGEYIFKPKPKKIVMPVAYLKVEFRFPLHH